MARRIALFAPSMCGGGAERIFATVANGFAQRGWRTDLVLVRAEGPYLRDLDPSVNVVDLGRSRAVRAVLPLRRWVNGERPDAVLSTVSSANVAAMLAAALPGPPMRLIVREANTPSEESRLSPVARQRFLPYLVRALKGRIARVVAVSEGSADDLARCYGIGRSRIEVIPNPVLTRQLPQLAAQEPQHPWLLDPDLRVVIAVGRLSAQKNYPLLLEAFAALPDPAHRRLLILGEGESRGELTALAARLGIGDRIDLPGFVDNPFPSLAAADVFVLSSDFEGLPATLIQALACGCPVVSTDCPSGPAEILLGGRYGRLVPVRDRAALAAAIDDVLAGRWTAPEAADLERFAEHASIDRYEQLVLDVIEGRHRRRKGG